MKAVLHGVTRRRTNVTSTLQRIDMQMLCEITKYLGARQVVGTSILQVQNVERHVYIWTVEDGEHLLILIQRRHACYWTPTREPLELLHSRAYDWLSEPPPRIGK